MVSLLKEKKKTRISPHRLGRVLVELNLRSARSEVEVLQNNSGLDSHFDTQKTRREMSSLRIFTTDFAVAMSLDSSMSREVLDAYYASYEKGLNEVHDEGGSIIPTLIESFFAYTKAVKTDHHLGPSYAVGATFAELCGYPMDAAVTYFGSVLFTGTLKSVSDLLGSY